MTLPAPSRLSLARRYRSTFCIFPAMIPLIELLPWLLGLVGGAAGLTEILREKIGRRPRQLWLMGLALVLVLTGAGVFLWHESRLPAKDTSIAILPTEFSKITTYAQTETKPLVLPAQFGLLWQQATTSQLMGMPVIAGSQILIGTLDRTLEARSKDDGHLLWVMKKKEHVFTSALVLGDTSIIGEGLHTAPSSILTGFKTETGQPLWERAFRSHIETAPAYDPDSKTIFQPAGAEGLWALDHATGDVKWHAAIGHIDVTPYFEQGRLFVPAKLTEADDGSELFEIDPDDGDILSKTRIPGNPMGDMLKGPDGTMVFTTAVGQVGLNKPTDKGWIHVADEDGKMLWSKELAAMPLPEGQIWADKGLVYLTLKNSTLVAVDVINHKIAWSVRIGGEFKSDAVLIEAAKTPLVVAVTADGFVGIRNALDGTPIASLKLDGGAYASPVYQDDILYLAAPYKLYAYGPVSAIGEKR